MPERPKLERATTMVNKKQSYDLEDLRSFIMEDMLNQNKKQAAKERPRQQSIVSIESNNSLTKLNKVARKGTISPDKSSLRKGNTRGPSYY